MANKRDEQTTEMEIHERHISRKKERKHALDQEKSKIQENMIENNKKKL